MGQQVTFFDLFQTNAAAAEIAGLHLAESLVDLTEEPDQVVRPASIRDGPLEPGSAVHKLSSQPRLQRGGN